MPLKSAVFLLFSILISTTYSNLSFAGTVVSDCPVVLRAVPNKTHDFNWLDEVRTEEGSLVGSEILFDLTNESSYVQQSDGAVISFQPSIQGKLLAFSSLGSTFTYKIRTLSNEVLLVVINLKNYSDLENVRWVKN